MGLENFSLWKRLNSFISLKNIKPAQGSSGYPGRSLVSSLRDPGRGGGMAGGKPTHGALDYWSRNPRKVRRRSGTGVHGAVSDSILEREHR